MAIIFRNLIYGLCLILAFPQKILLTDSNCIIMFTSIGKITKERMNGYVQKKSYVGVSS